MLHDLWFQLRAARLFDRPVVCATRRVGQVDQPTRSAISKPVGAPLDNLPDSPYSGSESTRAMTPRPTSSRNDGLLPGTLDMLILRTLVFGPAHGHQIATTIEHTSEDVLRVDHGSLYPALHRLIKDGLISAQWGTSSNNRRAKFYELTPNGRKQLTQESTRWARMVDAIARIMQPVGDEE